MDTLPIQRGRRQCPSPLYVDVILYAAETEIRGTSGQLKPMDDTGVQQAPFRSHRTRASFINRKLHEWGLSKMYAMKDVMHRLSGRYNAVTELSVYLDSDKKCPQIVEASARSIKNSNEISWS